METKKFMPDLEAIERRKNIQPFGRAKIYIKNGNKAKEEHINFTLYTTEQEAVIRSEEKYEHRPTESLSLDLSSYSASIKVTNLPLHVKQSKLSNFIYSKVPINSVVRVFIPTDKKKLPNGEMEFTSKGYAYVECRTREAAHEVIKIMNGKVLDSFKLYFEFSK
ncbi:hypothetical protein NUSPORA_01103 [Nucleospora cyclopteri]